MISLDGGRRQQGRQGRDYREEKNDICSDIGEKEEKVSFYACSPDRKVIEYWNQLIKEHPYWDKRPTLRDDIQQQPGNQEGKRTVKEDVQH